MIEAVEGDVRAESQFPVLDTPQELPNSVDTDASDDEFAAVVDDLKDYIASGDVFQIVPSRTFSTPCHDALGGVSVPACPQSKPLYVLRFGRQTYRLRSIS